MGVSTNRTKGLFGTNDNSTVLHLYLLGEIAVIVVLFVTRLYCLFFWPLQRVDTVELFVQMSCTDLCCKILSSASPFDLAPLGRTQFPVMPTIVFLLTPLSIIIPHGSARELSVDNVPSSSMLMIFLYLLPISQS